jgi:U3 small nucleolar RNA-associated protein 7
VIRADNLQIALQQKIAAQSRAEEEKRKIQNGEVVKETGALARFG